MSGNRVEELEARVEELEASISGLTEELMQTKSRLEDLEDDATGEYIEADIDSVAGEDSVPTENEATNPAENSSEGTESPETDEIIVA